MAQKTLGEWWKESTQKQKVLWIGGIIVVGALFGSFGDSDNPKASAEKTETNTTNNDESEAVSKSEEVSKRAYRQGYSDGQTGYGLPAYERASASEFYMSRGYSYSTEDYYVYEMGYNDGVYGRSKQY